jgi:hypothetical protein
MRLSTIGRFTHRTLQLPRTAALLVLMHGAASAQVIDQYLDPNVPGYGVEPGVTVTSREHPEYDPTGIRVGLFTLLPSLDESVGYDDNVTGTADPHGSALIDTTARLEATSDMSDGSLGGSLSVDNAEYPDQTSQSYTNWTAALGATHDFGQDTLTIAATHLNLNQTPQDLDVPELDHAIAYQVDDVRTSYKIDLGRINIEPGFDVSWYDFDNGSVHGVPYLQSYRDRISYNPSIKADYEFATRRRIVVVVRDTNAQFANALPGIAPQNYNDFSILAGISYDLDGVIGFRLLGGYEQRNFQSALYKTIQAPIAEGAVTWTPTGLTTVNATVARYIEDSSAEVTVGYTETALRLSVDHELYRNIILNANAGVYLDDYAQGGGQQEFYTVGAGATWRLNRNLRLAADYTYSSRQTNNAAVFDAFAPVGGVFGGNYTEDLFRVRLLFDL